MAISGNGVCVQLGPCALQGSSLNHRSVVITVITMNITAGYAKECLKKFSLSISLYSRRGAPLTSKKLSCHG